MSAARPDLTVAIVAGEESGDRLGAALMRALKDKTQGRVRFVGVGGAHMQREGLGSLASIERTGVIGFTALLAQLRTYLRLIRDVASRLAALKPDILVIVDSPEFTHRIAKRVRRAVPNIPIVDYVPPSVWAWRPWRAKAMRRYVDRVMAVLPFEPEAMARLNGPPCSYVGHPLSEQVGSIRPGEEDARRRNTPPFTVLLMPGSRSGELKRMLPIFQRTATLMAERGGSLEFVMPSVPAQAARLAQATSAWPVPVRIVSEQGDKEAAFRRARVAVVKSGTSTLELALAGVPMVAAYRVGFIEGLVAYAAINVPSIILANLVLGENVVPAYLQYLATPRRLAAAALDLLHDGPARRRQTEAFGRLDAIMEIGRAVPSERAAEIVLEEAGKRTRG
jgi:lipid-A-disaccharide synthase